MSRSPTRAELIAEVELLRKQLARAPARESGSTSVEALQEVEARHRRLSENASDLIAEVDSGGRFHFISANCEAVLGYRAEDLVGRALRDGAIFDNVHPEDRARLVETFLSEPGDGRGGVFVYRFRRADGAWRWFESHGRRVPLEEGDWRAVVISRDVTDREEALRRLRKSEERYRVVSETTHDLVAELDAEGRVVFVSPGCERLIGYTPDELVGTTPFGLIHPDDVEHLAELFVNRVSASHKPAHNQIFRIQHRDGSWRWLQGGGVNYETVDGEMHIVSVSRDVTDRLRAEDEKRQLEERVREAQKLESLAMMAAGVAHDFNNLLTPILGDAGLALLDLPPDSPVRSRLAKIQRAANHAAALTRQLLDYAGIGSLDVEALDLSQLVRDVTELLHSAISKRATLHFELGSDLPAVEADAAQLSQVVMNLITNASEAIEAGETGAGRIDVRSGFFEVDRVRLSQMFMGESLDPGRYVFFEVEDTGGGMDEQTRARIFDPFFTTKFTGRGLGLAAALGIVRKHGGTIDIQSRRGGGTRIRVLFPAASARAPVRESREAWDPRFRGSGSVLVADDDDGARELLAETIRRAGFTALCAEDGAEAVEIFRQDEGEIVLVILDRTMPGAGGEEALDGIRRLDPDVPVLLVSGYSRESTEQHLAGRRIDAFLQKPFLPEALLHHVRELLGD